ncbi:MAG: AgmX/PglI C-terminal domain-containing protein [Polyangiaceae bacterium]|nr:AgmX/PglI C-terminal domain-containing protein [Polyangiaceae bacterium]
MTVRITVDAQGTITNATSIAPGTASPAELTCILGALRRLTVPPPNRAPHAVDVTLQFDPFLAPDSSAPSRPAGPLSDAPPSTDYADHITRTIRQARGAFRLCHERYLRCCPNLSDRVGLSFTIEKDGSVAHATSTADTSVPDGEAGCVVEAVRSLTFPPPPKGRLVVRYPLHFSSMSP